MLPWLEGVLWFSVITVVAVTVGYPVVLFLAGLFVRRSRTMAASEPTVSLIISAHNEEACIAQKIENSLALDYPPDLLEVIVASDGSTDRTGDIVASYSGRGVLLKTFARIGKTGVQNQVARTARGEILVFSDANAFYRRDAIRKLVRNFADCSVGCVSGQLVYDVKGGSAGDCERSYWSYEKFMKRRESDLSSLIGANGSIYAIRKGDYVEIDSDLISDLVEPLAIVRNGKRVVYEPEAISTEEASVSAGVEFRRKVRILTRSIKGLVHMRALLNPFRYGFFSIQLITHKLLRYFTPFFLTTGAASLMALAIAGRYRSLFTTVLVGVLAAIVIGNMPNRNRRNPLVLLGQFAYYYLIVNYALVPAWLNVIRGHRITVWVPERKQA